MGVLGCDYAWDRPSVTALQRAGVRFVCRYLSHDRAKNLSRAEADALSAAGIWIVAVWESSTARALDGRAAGVADAKTARGQAGLCGMPADRPIYFAVDFNATAAQQTEIGAYLGGAASVIGRDRVGIYAGVGPVERALDAGQARWAWQTRGWSGGRWDPRAHIQQYAIERDLDGVDVDYNRATKSDYGQWRVGVTAGEDDMRYYGQLVNGEAAITPISIHPGDVSAIGFACDNGLAGLPPAKLRVAFQLKDGTWKAERLVVDSTKPKPWLRIPEGAGAVSVQRDDKGDVPIAWDAS